MKVALQKQPDTTNTPAHAGYSANPTLLLQRKIAKEEEKETGGRLPHYDRIQQSFGRHDVSHIQAHVGAEAAAASGAIGAAAYAPGVDISPGMPVADSLPFEVVHPLQRKQASLAHDNSVQDTGNNLTHKAIQNNIGQLQRFMKAGKA
ncbi:hypothetical protein SAMN05421788_103294 [Filimonas lacunae]|uniref:Uncharacterized protein n=1 Tax=Filimonas lacunae TaxID=477680 RepID=A0A173MKM4_9BACT|nr:hypothetical protein [Filimonas lacunae]BAV07948.1 hypothetical protein FLA_3980 [Filimonas lacunae]SIT07039.1 hypothetical protein SAMN05421788_103294 [Filimonas lacunae]